MDDEAPRTSASSLGKPSRDGQTVGIVSLRCGGDLQLHILPPGRDVSDLIPNITRDFIRAGTPAADITQQMIDAEVQGTPSERKAEEQY